MARYKDSHIRRSLTAFFPEKKKSSNSSCITTGWNVRSYTRRLPARVERQYNRAEGHRGYGVQLDVGRY